MQEKIDAKRLQQWQGRQESLRDEITAFPVRALAATIEPPYVDLVQRGDILPPLWHWLYFLPLHPQSALGADGHARKGGFLPPVPLPRRMWAGGRFGFTQPLRIGDSMEKTSTIASVKFKEGRSGPLVFVTVRHDITVAGHHYLWEEHDIVYRDAPTQDTPIVQPTLAESGAWQREIVPDDVLLFRYSALTFNSHRIHYDRRYVTGAEGYPGLIVHGPLIATLLIDLLLRQIPEAKLTSFSFRAVHPTFDTQPFYVNGQPSADGKTVRLWASDHAGYLTMDAVATLA
jgi:3-methylfumaryl-CoA hydratase